MSVKTVSARLFLLDFFRVKLDFYFAALAVFWWGQNLFNEKELQARDGSVPRSLAARCPVFDGLSNFPLGLMCYSIVI